MQFLVVLCCHNIPLRNFNNRSGGVTSRSWSHAHKGMIKDRKFILLSYKMHFLNNSLNKERKDLRMSKFNVVIAKRAWGASCLWIIECCSHDKSFFMWIFAIFPSLHHGTKNPKTNTTTTQACGSSLFGMLSHPNGSGEAHYAVMSWGNFLLAKLQVNMWNPYESDANEQLMIRNEKMSPAGSTDTVKEQLVFTYKDRIN